MTRTLQVLSTEPGDLTVVLPDVLELKREEDDHLFMEQVLIETWDGETTNIHFFPNATGLSKRAMHLLLGPRLFERIAEVPSSALFQRRDVEVSEEEYTHILTMIGIDTGHYEPALVT